MSAGVWNHNGAHLREHADMEHDADGGTIASKLTILSRVDVFQLRQDTTCDDDELPALLRCQAE